LIESAALSVNQISSGRIFSIFSISRASLDQKSFEELLYCLSGLLSGYTEQKVSVINSILRCFAALVEKQSLDPVYLPHLYWICLIFMQFGEIQIFQSSAKLFEILLKLLEDRESRYMSILELHNYRHAIGESIDKFHSKLRVNCGSDASLFLCYVCFKGFSEKETVSITISILKQLLNIQKHESYKAPPEKQLFIESVPCILLLAPSEQLAKVFQLAGIPTAKRSRSSVYGGGADQQVIFLIDKLFDIFETQTEGSKIIELYMLTKLLEITNKESELLIICRMLARMAERGCEMLLPL
jgi:hypothetical protein